MKKSLIALAALAFVGAAAAQSSVTLYGVADIWVGKSEGGKVQAGTDGVANSRIGFRGTEDLGGGLKANFNFEQYVDLAGGATRNPTGTALTNPLFGQTFDRQANVGFSGGFGTIKLGKSWNPMDDIFGAANSGFDSKLAANGVWQNGYTGTAAAQIYYATPEFSGFSGAYSTQLTGNAAKAAKVSAFNLKYAAGPIAAAVGYEDDAKQKGTMFNGSYDLGMAKLLGSYFTTKPDGGGAKTNSYQLGADVPLSSALTLSVGYASSKVDTVGATSSTGFGVAAAYGLSKRTTIYGGLRATNNVAKKDLWAVGVNHSF